ncbi:peptidase [Cellulomonas bogoriensis 69B4 = DSM 16987]|uniref:Peptidase n=2 Tax=Cellulomonas bogoriensis TaxID=301388 RepID=A0A0A0BZE5_9CELL|nr:peptidase [Cellulomonas bogoriensis 69B4 = DSM 16987]
MDRASGRSGRARPGVWLTAAAVALVWFVGSGSTSTFGPGWTPADLLGPRALVEVDGRTVAVPRPASSEGRLAPEVPVTTSGEHAFLHVHDDGSPVGYDPCRPVEYVVRPDRAPRSGQSLIDDAVQVVAEASGLVLVQVGETDEPPLMDRPLIQPDRYGPGWAPVLIAWSGPDEVSELEGQVAGVGGSAAVPGADGSGLWLAAGRVALDAEDLGALLSRNGGYERARAIVVHELAHVLGLDHVDDPDELMHPLTSSRTDLGPGDRQGLALVGQVGCEGFS